MAKYIAQAMVLGAQVLSRAFARALQQEYAATQAAAQKGSGNEKQTRQQAETNIKTGISLDEAKNILNVEHLDPEIISKNFEHLFNSNDKSKGGSLYLQSKGFFWPTRPCRYALCEQRSFSVMSSSRDVFSRTSKEQLIKCMEKLKIDFVTNKTAREAAVLIPLCKVNGEPSVLLTMRSVKMGRNKGDVSFPGGMKELSDKTSIEIALREAEEEIGVLQNVKIWTTMPSFPSRTGSITITPVVAFIGDIFVEDFTVNKDEVEFVFAVSLESLCDPRNIFYTRYKRGYAVPVYIVNEYRIWGLTAMILHYLLKCLVPDDYKNTLQVGVFPRLKINCS